ncbi:T-cell surface antigen CD2-like isoform X2 [Hypomesus transpacificus]|uniref:T-cell surface antigen CD2-like isoform X2 n=1 Tax=Hypomesus transpacificus TaxID=137520 RepID=UPI001F078C32|nr:T-cell surface antigen CD2-like isoform X2 [Hypomesus transpacificus]
MTPGKHRRSSGAENISHGLVRALVAHSPLYAGGSKKGQGQRGQTTAELHLLLEHLQLGDTGRYTATIYDNEGLLLKNTTILLHVLSPVSKPRVTHNCSSESARLLCDVGNDVKVNVSWRLNGQETGEAGLTLSVPRSDKKIRPGDKYACLVKNRVSEEKSEHVHLECTDEYTEASSPVLLFGLERWISVSILAGLTSLIFIIIIIICVCVFMSWQRKNPVDEEEVIRRATLTKPHCQATLHQRCPPPGAQGGARPQNRAPTLPTSNSQRQARPKPPEQLPILVQPQLTVRRTAPRTNRS